jgi:hypothetical protein
MATAKAQYGRSEMARPKLNKEGMKVIIYFIFLNIILFNMNRLVKF